MNRDTVLRYSLSIYVEIGALCLPVAVRFVKGVVMLGIIVNSFP
jgi:hypothetical protein